MNRRVGCLAFTIAIAFVLRASGQQRAGSEIPRPATIDSAAVQLLLGNAYSRLGEFLAAAATSTTVRACRIELPKTNPKTWERVRSHLLLALRGRPATESDSARAILFVSGLRLSGDTLFARITVGTEWRCKADWSGSSTADELIGVWHGTAWAYPMRVVGTVYGDSVPCPR